MRKLYLVLFLILSPMLGFSQNLANEAIICADELYLKYPADARGDIANNQIICFGENIEGVACLIISCSQSSETDSIYKSSRIIKLSKTPDFELLEESKRIIGGQEGLQFIHTSRPDSLNTIWESESVIQHKGTIYSFIYSSNNYDLFKSYLSLKDSILESVAFLEYGNGNCEIAKQGRFEYENGTEGTFVEIRGRNHIEYHKNSNRTIYNQIDWINDCEFEIIFDHTDKPENWPFKKGDKINIKILTASKSSFSYVWNIKGRKGINKLILTEK